VLKGAIASSSRVLSGSISVVPFGSTVTTVSADGAVSDMMRWGTSLQASDCSPGRSSSSWPKCLSHEPTPNSSDHVDDYCGFGWIFLTVRQRYLEIHLSQNPWDFGRRI
jgi:hypothetical protein